MLGLSLFVLCLAAPQAAPVQVGATAATDLSGPELRPIAWRDEPRSRALALPVEVPTPRHSELREPFANVPTTRAPAAAATVLREPFAHPRPVSAGAPMATERVRSNLREPFSHR